MPVTSFFAAVLALMIGVLAVRVIALRGNPLFGFFRLKSDGEWSLERAIRAHGNLTENAPIFLILMLLCEWQAVAVPLSLTLWGALFVIGRVLHGVCFGFLRENLPLRVGGTALTQTAIAVLALTLLFS